MSRAKASPYRRATSSEVPPSRWPPASKTSACTVRRPTRTADVSGLGQGNPALARCFCARKHEITRLAESSRALTTTCRPSCKRGPCTDDMCEDVNSTSAGAEPSCSSHRGRAKSVPLRRPQQQEYGPRYLWSARSASSDGSVWSAHSDQRPHAAALCDMRRVTSPRMMHRRRSVVVSDLRSRVRWHHRLGTGRPA
jgi:hypothetical protein